MTELSVIIPVYNSRYTLKRCVKSVLAQNLSGMEIILVNDGSSDGSSELCDDIVSNNRQVRVIHRINNGGLSAARNSGIEASKGRWLSFVDSDDELVPGTLAGNMEWAGSHPATDLIEFPVTVHYGSPESLTVNFEPTTVSGNRIFRHWIENEGYRHCYACNKLFRRRLFDNIRFPEGETFEDAAILPDILHLCREVRYSDKGRYLYHKSEGSITRTYKFKNQEPLFRHNFRLLREISDPGVDEIHKVRLWNVCLNLLIDLCRCRDAEHTYLESNTKQLSLYRPCFGALLSSGLPLKQVFKSVSASILGAKSFCNFMALKKYPS